METSKEAGVRARLAFVGIIVGSILALSVTAGACGGGGGSGEALTLDEYFQQLQGLDDQFKADSDELEAQFDALSDADALEQGPDLLRQQGDLVRDFVDALADLNPPDEASAVHEEAVSSGRDVVERFSAMGDEFENAETLIELFAPFDDAAFNAAADRFDQACLSMEQFATDKSIALDLSCGSGE